MATEKSKKKKTVQPLPIAVGVVIIVLAVAAMAAFVGYIVNPPTSNDSSVDYSGNQSFGDASSNEDPALSLGTTKERLADAERLDIVVFGSYEQDGNTENGKEGIEWIVLENENNRLVLLSKNCLDAVKYHQTRGNTAWADSDLNRWLNSDFLSAAFSANEQAMLENGVSVPSKEEAGKYFEFDSWRVAKPTQYAVSNGARSENGDCWWWLRDSGTIESSAMYVNFDGSLRENGFAVDYDAVGVRPIIYVTLAE